MFNDIDNLREQAARCMRLAKDCANPAVAESLLALAADYLERAAKLAVSPAAAKEWQDLQPK
jgi:molecular chaperone GrpE (heat shock protein)